MVTRRDFLKSLAVSVPIGVFGVYRWRQAPAPPRAEVLNDPVVYFPTGEDGRKVAIPGRRRPLVRPPGAVAEAEFKRRCIRCHRCGQGCPNDTIRFIDDPDSPHGVGTPIIRPREQHCILCMKCNNTCPSGALQKIDGNDYDAIVGRVKMGVAVVDRSSCNSYNDDACGKCVRACRLGLVSPAPDQRAIVAIWAVAGGEKPVVNADVCVGCGACEKACIQLPQAIRVVPLESVV